MGELSLLELRLLLAAWELHARYGNSTPAINKGVPQKFLRIIGRLWAPLAGGLRVLAPCYVSLAQEFRLCRHELLFGRSRNEQDGVGSSFPLTKSVPAIRRLSRCGNTTRRAERRNAKHATDWRDRSPFAVPLKR